MFIQQTFTGHQLSLGPVRGMGAPNPPVPQLQLGEGSVNVSHRVLEAEHVCVRWATLFQVENQGKQIPHDSVSISASI